MFTTLRNAGYHLSRRYQSSPIVRACTSSAYKPIKRPTLFPIGKHDPVQTQTAATAKANQTTITSLAERLRMRIQAAGPITLAQYMKEVLTNWSGGYYTSSKPILGAQGDFVTSPEIGQIFGELIAVWLYAEWQKCGSPEPLQLVELGPGRGTMMQDVVRVLSRFGMTRNLSIELVEVSRFLSEVQSQRLCLQSDLMAEAASLPHYRSGETVSGIPVRWYERIEDVPKGFSVVLAHEFFDALPVHKFQRQDDDWREVLVDYADGRFRLVAANGETPMLKLFRQQVLRPDEQREHIEHSFEAHAVAEHLAHRLERDGGFTLIMDYGHTGEGTDTFRAFRAHKQVDALADPGTADLTADVDFAQLRRACVRDDRLVAFGPVEQGEFIERCGGRQRLQQLVESTHSADTKENLESGYRMLTEPEQMGKRFKFMAAFPAVLREHLKRFPVNGFQ